MSKKVMVLTTKDSSTTEKKKKPVAKKNKVESPAPVYTEKELDEFAQEYIKISEEAKKLGDKKTELATKIKEATKELGVKNDKGSHYYQNDSIITGNQAKKSVKFDDGATTRGLLDKLGVLDKCIEMVEVINPDKVEALVTKQEVPLKVFKKMHNVKTTYSVYVKKREEVKEADVQEFFKSVASKKG